MHTDILRPAPSHIRARYPRCENVRIKSASRAGMFTVWADPPSAGPHVNLNVRTARALAGPMEASRIDSSYPGPGNLQTRDSSD